MEKVPNTCGINQKLMKDILEDIKANKDARIKTFLNFSSYSLLFL
jgi:hypothetical protein